MEQKLKKITGFTLVELLLVILILAILASIVVPRMTSASGDAKKTKCDCNRTNLINALEFYAAKNDGAYPATQGMFNTNILNSATYFPHGAPICPYGTIYTYISTAGQETVTAHSH
jgi:general secretion pathway protein G